MSQWLTEPGRTEAILEVQMQVYPAMGQIYLRSLSAGMCFACFTRRWMLLLVANVSNAFPKIARLRCDFRVG